MKNRKNQIYLCYFMLIFALYQHANAQIHCLGLTQQTNARNNNISFYGVEFQSYHAKWNLGMGYANNFNPEIPTKKLNFNFDYNLWQFHHALMKSRFVPYLGFQTEIAQTTIKNEGFPSIEYQNQWFAKTGIKLSYDRFIGSIDYQLNSKNQFVNFKLMYTVLITQRCPKKRINEINKLDFSQF